jgi:hypothetical protein
MIIRMNATLRLLGMIVAGAIALAVVQQAVQDRVRAAGVLTTSDGDTVDVTDSARRAGLRFAAGVAPAQRGWIGAAVARARPEAARLIAEVDGLVTIGTYVENGETLGVTRSGPGGFTVDFNLTRLDGDRAMDRATVVLHELGHVIDYVLVEDELVAKLDAAVPRDPDCPPEDACAYREERFADTFAKWALRGAVSLAGSGYGIPAPASIEDWGAPLGRLAVEVRVTATRAG